MKPKKTGNGSSKQRQAGTTPGQDEVAAEATTKKRVTRKTSKAESPAKKTTRTTRAARKPAARARARATATSSTEPSPSTPAAKTTDETRPMSAEERHQLICEAAYFRAQERGFSAGGELDDWLWAEARIDGGIAAR